MFVVMGDATRNTSFCVLQRSTRPGRACRITWPRGCADKNGSPAVRRAFQDSSDRNHRISPLWQSHPDYSLAGL